MRKTAETAYPVHPLIAERWSPRAFAPEPIKEADLMPLFEAARWAASSYNLQPWHFVYGLRGQPAFDAILGCLVPGNAAWAGRAGALVIAVARVVRDDGIANRHAVHDLGQSLASLALQATADGLVVHQMSGFDPDKARAALGVPEGFEPLTAVAIGRPAGPDDPPDERTRDREKAPRARRTVAEFAYPGRWPDAAG